MRLLNMESVGESGPQAAEFEQSSPKDASGLAGCRRVKTKRGIRLPRALTVPHFVQRAKVEFPGWCWSCGEIERAGRSKAEELKIEKQKSRIRKLWGLPNTPFFANRGMQSRQRSQPHLVGNTVGKKFLPQSLVPIFGFHFTDLSYLSEIPCFGCRQLYFLNSSILFQQ